MGSSRLAYTTDRSSIGSDVNLEHLPWWPFALEASFPFEGDHEDLPYENLVCSRISTGSRTPSETQFLILVVNGVLAINTPERCNRG